MTDKANTTAAPSTFHPWSRLPYDVKLRIIDHCLRFGRSRGLTPNTHGYYTTSTLLVPLILTCSEFRPLALRSHYTNGIVLGSRNSKNYKYPQPSVSPFVRKVEFHLNIPERSLHPMKDQYKEETYYYDRTHISQLMYEIRDGAPRWQKALQHVECLHIMVEMWATHEVKDRQPNWYYYSTREVGPAKCQEGNEDFRKLFEDMQIALRPAAIEVVVRGFDCGDFDGCGHKGEEHSTCPWGCGERIAKAIRDMVILRSSNLN